MIWGSEQLTRDVVPSGCHPGLPLTPWFRPPPRSGVQGGGSWSAQVYSSLEGNNDAIAFTPYLASSQESRSCRAPTLEQAKESL